MIIYIFTASAIGVFGMVGLRMIENRRRKKIFISRFLTSFDHSLVNKIHSTWANFDSMNEYAQVFVKQELPRRIKYLSFVVKKTVRDKYSSLMPSIDGRYHLRKNGDVSSFLRDIAKHKKENGSGRIDDETIKE